MAVIEGLFLKFLDDSLGHDRPDALDDTGAYISLKCQSLKPVPMFHSGLVRRLRGVILS